MPEKKGYQPTPEEINKAESMMTHGEKELSKKRETRARELDADVGKYKRGEVVSADPETSKIGEKKWQNGEVICRHGAKKDQEVKGWVSHPQGVVFMDKHSFFLNGKFFGLAEIYGKIVGFSPVQDGVLVESRERRIGHLPTMMHYEILRFDGKHQIIEGQDTGQRDREGLPVQKFILPPVIEESQLNPRDGKVVKERDSFYIQGSGGEVKKLTTLFGEGGEWQPHPQGVIVKTVNPDNEHESIWTIYTGEGQKATTE